MNKLPTFITGNKHKAEYLARQLGLSLDHQKVDSEYTGSISDRPRGENGFGFDAFFIAEGTNLTRAEMSPEENERTYAEYMKPFAAVKEFLMKDKV